MTSEGHSAATHWDGGDMHMAFQGFEGSLREGRWWDDTLCVRLDSMGRDGGRKKKKVSKGYVKMELTKTKPFACVWDGKDGAGGVKG
jgi:hypothetical protein